MKGLLLIILLLWIMIVSAIAEPIVTESTSTSAVTTDTNSDMTVHSPPPSAISPSISSHNSDVCTVAFSGAVQTQVLGISGGSAVRDMNCERLKLAKTLYDMGMKVAAVSTMCQDKRVFNAMNMAGTPCPYNGKIGNEAKAEWKKNPDKNPVNIEEEARRADKTEGILWGIGGSAAIALLLLL